MSQFLSTYNAILKEVQLKVRCSSLPDLEPANVVVKKVDRERERIEVGLPGVLISPIDSETIPLGGGTNIRDDIGYPVAVSMLDVQRQQSFDNEPELALEGCPDPEYEFDDRLYWREVVRKVFIRQRLNTDLFPNIYTCEVEPFEVIDAREYLNRNIWISSLLLRFISREPRGADA